MQNKSIFDVDNSIDSSESSIFDINGGIFYTGSAVPPPSGYTVAWTTDPITDLNFYKAAFQFADAEVGATYNYTISSSGGGTDVTGSGTISTAIDTISNINLTTLLAGTLTLSVTLTNGGGTGVPATDTVSKPVMPTDYGAVLWLDSADTATISHVLNAVTQINDKSGNGNHATQGTAAARPSTNTRTINSLNAVDFDGSSDYLILPAALHTISQGANTMFFGGYLDATKPAFIRAWQGKDSVPATLYGVGYNGGANIINARNGVSGGAVMVGVTSFLGRAGVTCMRRNGTLQEGFDNLGSYASNTSATDQTLTELTIGWDVANTADQQYNGAMMFAVLTPSNMSNADANTLMNQMVTKWAMSWTNL